MARLISGTLTSMPTCHNWSLIEIALVLRVGKATVVIQQLSRLLFPRLTPIWIARNSSRLSTKEDLPVMILFVHKSGSGGDCGFCCFHSTSCYWRHDGGCCCWYLLRYDTYSVVENEILVGKCVYLEWRFGTRWRNGGSSSEWSCTIVETRLKYIHSDICIISNMVTVFIYFLLILHNWQAEK